MPPFAYEAFVRGEVLLARGRYEDAVASFLEARAAPDRDSYLLSRLALAQALAGDTEAAERSLREADEIDPCSEASYTVRGQLMARAGRHEEAVQAYAHALSCAPRSADAVIALAQALDQAGEREAAKQTLRDSPAPRSAQLLLELALLDADPSTIAIALERLASERVPATGVLARAVAGALERGHRALARRLCEASPAALPAALRARVLLASHLRDEARALLDRTPDRQLGALDTAVPLLLEAGLPERAELLALTHRDRGAGSLLLSRALAAQGRVEEAAALLEEAPTTAAARAELAALLERHGVPKGLLLVDE